MTHRHESSYWIAKDALAATIARVAEEPKDGWRLAGLAACYRDVAECELLWKHDVAAAREAFRRSGQVVLDFLPTVTDADTEPWRTMFGWDVADAIFGQLAGQYFEPARELSSLALNDNRLIGAAENDFGGLLLPLVACTVLGIEVSSDRWQALRLATKAEPNVLGFYTCLHGIHDRDAGRIDAGLYQMDLGHEKNRRNRYGPRYWGDFLFPATGCYNLAVHLGIDLHLGFDPRFLADDLLLTCG
jgi:hypothetical protein